jgi:hypothetical protein
MSAFFIGRTTKNSGGNTKVEELMLLENPRRHHRRSRRNPAMASVGKLTQGVDVKEIGAAAAGVIVAALLPNYIIKIPAGTTPTTIQKVEKLGIALGSAIALGYLAKRFMGPQAGKAAVIGGLAGTATQAISAFTSLNVGRPVGQLARPMVSNQRPPIGRTYEPEFQKVGTV